MVVTILMKALKLMDRVDGLIDTINTELLMPKILTELKRSDESKFGEF